MIASRVIQYRVKEEITVRRQEMVEEGVQYFRCWRVGHYKWEYPNIEVARKKRREKEVAYVARLQKTQQKRRPACSTWEKVQKYYEKWNIPPEDALLLEQKQIL